MKHPRSGMLTLHFTDSLKGWCEKLMWLNCGFRCEIISSRLLWEEVSGCRWLDRWRGDWPSCPKVTNTRTVSHTQQMDKQGTEGKESGNLYSLVICLNGRFTAVMTVANVFISAFIILCWHLLFVHLCIYLFHSWVELMKIVSDFKNKKNEPFKFASTAAALACCPASVCVCVYVHLCDSQMAGELLLPVSWEKAHKPTSKQQHIINHTRPVPWEPVLWFVDPLTALTVLFYELLINTKLCK